MGQQQFGQRSMQAAKRIAKKTVAIWQKEIEKAVAEFPEVRESNSHERHHREKVIALTIEGTLMAIMQSSFVMNGIRALDEPTMLGMANEMYVFVARIIQSQFPKLKFSVVISNTMREERP